ncbi:DUF1918 domain-containing protein [Nonomuraea basaltis]|nr:DUF1918 domain-containing protein [Nonomuraea basaltis]
MATPAPAGAGHRLGGIKDSVEDLGLEVRRRRSAPRAAAPPFGARQDGHESLVYPGPDALVMPVAGQPG